MHGLTRCEPFCGGFKPKLVDYRQLLRATLAPTFMHLPLDRPLTWVF